MTTNIDMSRELILHRHHNGVQLRRPSQKSLEPSLSEIMHKQFSVFFIDTENVFINANEHVLASTNSPSLASLKGNTYHHICRNSSISNHLHTNNRTVMDKQKTLFFDEDCSFDENRIRAICAKMPWYDHRDNVIGVFAFSYLSETPFVACNQTEFTSTINTFFDSNQPTPKKSIMANTPYSPREIDLIHVILRGKTMNEAASLLNITIRTAEHYFVNIKKKAGVKTRSALMEALFEQGFVVT